MIWLLAVLGYLMMATIYGTVASHIDPYLKDDQRDGLLIFVSLMWPFCLTSDITSGVIQLPRKHREWRQARSSAKHQQELERERRFTEILQERANQAEAIARECKAMGLPPVPK